MAAAPFNWAEYLKLARDLAGREDEACRRSSVSRAYYYVYHLGLQRATQNGFVSLRGESTHTQLWRLFNTSPEPECINLGQIALRLKEKRERADYEQLYRRLEEELPQLLADAETFSERLARLPSRHPNPRSQRQ